MKITKVYCDHCGKILDDMSDYIELRFEISHICHIVDLCAKCLEKLNEKIDDFAKRSEQNAR